MGLCFGPAGRSHHRQHSGRTASDQTLVGARIHRHPSTRGYILLREPGYIQLEKVLGHPEPGSYYLCLGQLVSYKGVDLAVQACTATKRNLIVAGDGPERKKLEKMAGPTVRFLGHVPNKAIPALYAGCRAFLFPGEENFGITPLEASAAGRPVIAYGKDGVLDSITPDENSLFFEQQNIDSLIVPLGDFETAEDTVWNTDGLKAHAQSFSEVLFRGWMGTYIRKAIEDTKIKRLSVPLMRL